MRRCRVLTILIQTVLVQVLEAASRYGLRTMTVRLGQACGSKATGAWSTSEWFPILVKSSVALGIIPELRGVRSLNLHLSSRVAHLYTISSLSTGFRWMPSRRRTLTGSPPTTTSQHE